MRIDLYTWTEAKLEDVLEQLQIRFGLEDLTPEELIDALLDLAAESVVTDQAPNAALRDQIISLCTSKMMGRS